MTNSANVSPWCPKIDETVDVDVCRLTLDVKNPRLLRTDGSKGDEYIIADLYKAEDLRELLQSISTNGYMNIEPLVVVLNKNGDKLVVLEGNRRLAAILLFLNDELVRKTEKVGGVSIDMPKINDRNKKSLKSISVFRVKSRENARDYIGFKHINGPAKWNSYAKAKFAALWHEEEKVSLEEIARRIGDRHDTVRRMVTAIYVLDQAKRAGIYDISDRSFERFNFSHLYTALSRSDYMDYLGIGKSWAEIKPGSNLIPKNKLERLGNVLVWVFGSKQKDQEPIIRTQNPDIKRLGEVLCSSEARHILQASGDLDEAHKGTVSSEMTLSTALINARKNLGLAATSLTGYDGRDESLLHIAQNVSQAAKAVYAQMKKASRDAKDDDHVD